MNGRPVLGSVLHHDGVGKARWGNDQEIPNENQGRTKAFYKQIHLRTYVVIPADVGISMIFIAPHDTALSSPG